MNEELETKFCTNCRHDILSANFVIHTVHCQRNLSLCPKCSEPVPRNELNQHNEEQHTNVYCTGCNLQVEKCKLGVHESDECPKRKINCKICSMQVVAADLAEHEEYCGARTEKCPECGEFVMHKYKQLHLDSDHKFIKLNDENGPSMSWQSGKRTFGNFLGFTATSSLSPPGHHERRTHHHGANSLSGESAKEAAAQSKPKSNIYDLSKNGPDIDESVKKNLDMLMGNKVNYKDVQRDDKKQLDRSRRKSGTVLEPTTTSAGASNTSLASQVTGGRSSGAISKLTSVRRMEKLKNEKTSGSVSTTKDKSGRIWLNNDVKNNIVHSKRDNYQPQINSMESQMNKNVKKEKNKIIDDITSGCDATNLDRLLALQLTEDEENVDLDRLLALQLDEDENNSTKNILENSLSNSNTSHNNRLINFDSDEEFLIYDMPAQSNPVTNDVKLPCEFCDQLVSSSSLLQHQESCNKLVLPTVEPVEEMTELPCEFCSELIPQFRLTSHQMVCEASSRATMLTDGAAYNWRKVNNTDMEVNLSPKLAKRLNKTARDTGLHNSLDFSVSSTRSGGTRPQLFHVNTNQDNSGQTRSTKKASSPQQNSN